MGLGLVGLSKFVCGVWCGVLLLVLDIDSLLGLSVQLGFACNVACCVVVLAFLFFWRGGGVLCCWVVCLVCWCGCCVL